MFTMTHYQFPQIFLGFAAKDRYTVAESLLYHLENYGIPIWYDRHDLIIGDNRQKENFEKGIIESKYAILIFSESTEDCFCLNEEINIIYNRYKKGKIKVFPIIYNITFGDLPQKYKWIKELIYREITDKSGSATIVSSIVCRYLKDLSDSLSHKSLYDFTNINLKSDKNGYIKELLRQYYAIDHHNLNSRLTILYSVYLFIKSNVIYRPIVLMKPVEWLFSLTKLDLKIDFKELRIAENNLIILLNIIDDYYTRQ